jgi:hypothetical protein
LLIVEHRKTSGWSRRAADDVHNDVHAAETIADSISDGSASFGGGNVSGNKLPGALEAFPVYGPPDACVRGLREVAEAGAELILNPVFDEAEQMERLVADVMPKLS